MRFLTLVGLLAVCPVAARADLQCMARFSTGNWMGLTVAGSEMSATHCAAQLTLMYTPPQAYRLQAGPIKGGDHTTCQWSWTPSGNTHVLPDSGVPDSVICNLF